MSTKTTFWQADITCHRVATLLNCIFKNKYENCILCLTLDFFDKVLLPSKPTLDILYAYKTINNVEYDCPSKIK